MCKLKLFFASFLHFLCNDVTSTNIRHDGNKEDLMELLILMHRKSANTSTFSSTATAKSIITTTTATTTTTRTTIATNVTVASTSGTTTTSRQSQRLLLLTVHQVLPQIGQIPLGITAIPIHNFYDFLYFKYSETAVINARWYITEAYLEPRRTSTMELFYKNN